jgi:uncharacterized protein (TIGR03085 family)
VSASLARLERALLCELFLAVGPDQPTLCAGWTTHDLAAHLVIRERRPDAAIGIVVAALAAHTERVRVATAQRPFAELVALLHSPPLWSVGAIGPLDRATNTLEFFIHHEDVRRAIPDWTPRSLPREHEMALWHAVPGSARLALRRFRAGIAITAPGFGEAKAGNGPVEVALTGAPGELAMFLSGRQSAADVELTGPAEWTARLKKARLGI